MRTVVYIHIVMSQLPQGCTRGTKERRRKKDNAFIANEKSTDINIEVRMRPCFLLKGNLQRLQMLFDCLVVQVTLSWSHAHYSFIIEVPSSPWPLAFLYSSPFTAP